MPQQAVVKEVSFIFYLGSQLTFMCFQVLFCCICLDTNFFLPLFSAYRLQRYTAAPLRGRARGRARASPGIIETGSRWLGWLRSIHIPKPPGF